MGLTTSCEVRAAGDGTFDPQKTVIASGVLSLNLAVADLNGDGHRDIVTANDLADTVSVILGEAARQFAAPVDYPLAAETPQAVALADVDNDGAIDIITANQTSDNVSVLLGNGTGGFGPAAVFNVGDRPGDVALADINADGALDIVTANTGSDNVTVLFGDGAGDFHLPATIAVGAGPQMLAVVDFNTDGALDLVTVNLSDDSVSTVLGDGTGEFGGRVDIDVVGGPNAVRVADVNRDGALDIVVATIGLTDAVTVLLGMGAGTFVPGGTYPTGSQPFALRLTDVDTDGKIDVLTGAGPFGNDAVSILLGDGSGGFQPGASVEIGPKIDDLVPADLDRDGNLDVVLVSRASEVVVLWGNGEPGSGVFEPDAGPFIVPTPGATSSAPETVELADIDADGWLDVMTSNAADDSVYVLAGDGAGGLDQVLGPFLAGAPPRAKLGDVNRDGALDVVSADIFGRTVSVLLGDNSGAFAPRQVISVVNQPWALALADLDTDGDLDVVLANRDTDTVTVLRGDGSGQFANDAIYSVGNAPYAIALGDLNRDGALDVVTANNFSNDISILLGDGAGAFDPLTLRHVAVGRVPYAVRLGDLNADGVTDAAVANEADDTLTILLGDGQGNLIAQPPIPTGMRPEDVALADVDADGAIDVVTANSDIAEGNSISVLLGDGSGNIRQRRDFKTDIVPKAIALADVNRDGLLDAVTANRIGTISLLYGLRRPPNEPPVVESIAVYTDPVDLDAQPVANWVTVVFSDTGGSSDEPFSCTIDYGDGGAPEAGIVDGYTCTDNGEHVYTVPGVYTIRVTIDDAQGGTVTANADHFVVVFDSNGGFVTGAGWIDSPVGAYRPEPSLAGRATFGFVSRYKKGQVTPDGRTRFQFHAAGFVFSSDDYDWLVVAGARAQFKGRGSINGEGEYGFMLTAIDGEVNGGGGTDKFRIKIWDIAAGDALVYDNQLACPAEGEADTATPCTVLGGGSIVVHDGKGKK